MEKGMTQIQQGFLNNNLQLIKDGSKLVKEGNDLFSDKKSYLFLFTRKQKTYGKCCC